MSIFEVDFYLDEVFVGTKLITASDEEEAHELAKEKLGLDINEYE